MSHNITDSDLVDFDSGSLQANRHAEVLAAIESSEELQNRLVFVTRMSSSLKKSVTGFVEQRDSSFLTDNIMRAVKNSIEVDTAYRLSEISKWIALAFRPVVAATLVMIVVLAAYNYASVDQIENDRTAAEAVLGLPQVSIASAYEATY